MEIERRSAVLEGIVIETRDNGVGVIRGHAAVFSQMSEDLGGFREQIAPGAFAEALSKPDDVRALWNHDPNIILGRNLSGTLKLSEDVRGLLIEITPPDTGLVRDMVLEPMRRGDVTQMSFGFSLRPNGDNWAKDDEGRWIRTITKVRLFDVSPVTYPAYPQTDVTVAQRSLTSLMQGDVNTVKQAEAFRSEQARRRLQLLEL